MVGSTEQGGASPRHPFSLFVACASLALISVLLAFAVVGAERIDPRHAAWLYGDFSSMQFGWWGYRFDPAPAWPMTSARISWPLPIDVAMFDIIPMAALPLKLLSPYLPAEFQYFGALFVLNAALQGIFAFLLFFEIARQAPEDSGAKNQALAVAALAALFFVIAPFPYHRLAIAHPPLTAHWLIVAALWLYARSERGSLASTIGGFAALFFISAGVNPYLLAMTGGVYLACVSRLVWLGHHSWRALLAATAPFAAGVISLWVFGFLALGSEDVVPAGGYGSFSANLLSPIDPMQFPGATFLPPRIVASEWQVEGYGYLGLGVLLLVGFAIVLGILRQRLLARFTLPLLAVAAGAFAMALSTTVTLGPEVVAHIAPPRALMKILEIYRSSGRFVWVTDYILIAIAGALVIRLLPPRAARGVLAACLVVQAVDLAPTFLAVRDRLAADKPSRFTDAAFADLKSAHDRLIMVPPVQCPSSEEKEYPFHIFEQINDLVASSRLVTNNFHSARLPRDQQRYHCGEFLAEFPRTPADSRTAYLFTRRGFANFGATLLRTHSCDVAENMVLCRADRGEAGLTARAAAAFGDLAIRPDVSSRPARAPSWREVSQGFEREGDALRMTGRAARIDLISRLPVDAPLRVEITMSRGPDTDNPAALVVYLNNLRLGSLVDSDGAPRGVFSLPPGLVSEGRLTLAIEDASEKPIRAALESLTFAAETARAPLAPMTFSFAAGSGRSPWLADGWSYSEPWGLWSDGAAATLRLPRFLAASGPLSLVFDVDLFLAHAHGLDAQVVKTSVNGEPISSIRFDEGRARLALSIPAEVIARRAGDLLLRFDLPTAVSPMRIDVLNDPRILGIGLRSLTINPAP